MINVCSFITGFKPWIQSRIGIELRGKLDTWNGGNPFVRFLYASRHQWKEQKTRSSWNCASICHPGGRFCLTFCRFVCFNGVTFSLSKKMARKEMGNLGLNNHWTTKNLELCHPQFAMVPVHASSSAPEESPSSGKDAQHKLEVGCRLIFRFWPNEQRKEKPYDKMKSWILIVFFMKGFHSFMALETIPEQKTG